MKVIEEKIFMFLVLILILSIRYGNLCWFECMVRDIRRIWDLELGGYGNLIGFIEFYKGSYRICMCLYWVFCRYVVVV